MLALFALSLVENLMGAESTLEASESKGLWSEELGSEESVA